MWASVVFDVWSGLCRMGCAVLGVWCGVQRVWYGMCVWYGVCVVWGVCGMGCVVSACLQQPKPYNTLCFTAGTRELAMCEAWDCSWEWSS